MRSIPEGRQPEDEWTLPVSFDDAIRQSTISAVVETAMETLQQQPRILPRWYSAKAGPLRVPPDPNLAVIKFGSSWQSAETQA